MSNQQNEIWQNILKQPYCDPTKRMDFVLFYDVRDGNPNGDPDAGNLPRMDPETRHGIITDVCIKRKVRDYLTTGLHRSIYIQSQEALNTLIFRSARELSLKKEIEIMPIEISLSNDDIKKLLGEKEENTADDENIDKVHNWLNELSEEEPEGLEYDSENRKMTYFGEAKKSSDFKKLLIGESQSTDKIIEAIINKISQALAEEKKNSGGGKLSQKVRDKVKDEMCKKYDDIRLFGAVLTAGTNFGQVRGPMQLTFARSIEPILQMDAAITRCAITKESDRARKQTEFGRKSWLNWVVYKQHGFFNPLLGEQTHINKDDLARFWESLAFMFRNSDSASKGEMTMQDIIVFVHNHPRGNAPSHILFDEIKINDELSKDNQEIVTIKRDGFDKQYQIGIPKDFNKDDSEVKVYRPLKDIWQIKN